MAMKEIKSLTVSPNEEAETIERFQTFGWGLKGAPQEVRTQDTQIFTGQGSDGTEHYKTQRGVHYIKITFERDPARTNYEELKSLEAEYEALKDPYLYQDCPKVLGFVWIILIVIGCFLYLIPGIILLIIRLATYPKRKRKWEAIYDEYSKEKDSVDAKRKEILSKAQSLV